MILRFNDLFAFFFLDFFLVSSVDTASTASVAVTSVDSPFPPSDPSSGRANRSFEEILAFLLTFGLVCAILPLEISFVRAYPSFGLGRSRPLIRSAVSLILFVIS